MKQGTDEVSQDIEIIDEISLEDYGKANKAPPSANVYVIRIDKTTHKHADQFITGKQLLDLAKKQPIEQYKLFQKIHGGQRKEIQHDDTVDLREQGIERFQTVPLCETEG